MPPAPKPKPANTGVTATAGAMASTAPVAIIAVEVIFCRSCIFRVGDYISWLAGVSSRLWFHSLTRWKEDKWSIVQNVSVFSDSWVFWDEKRK